jgi:hypothetical protein
MRAYQPLDGCTINTSPPRIAHRNQIVGRKPHRELEVQLLAANEPALAQTTYGLGPARTFLDPLAERLTDGITGVAGSAPIDGR